jgi:hypothetical protein
MGCLPSVGDHSPLPRSTTSWVSLKLLHLLILGFHVSCRQFVHNGRIGGGNKYEHGTLKGFLVFKRRIMCGTQKLQIAFSKKLGGPIGPMLMRRWSGNVYKKKGSCHRSETLKRYKAKYQRFYCDWYTGTYNEICVANHIKPLITKELTFFSCFPFK